MIYKRVDYFPNIYIAQIILLEILIIIFFFFAKKKKILKSKFYKNIPVRTKQTSSPNPLRTVGCTVQP